MLLHHERFKHVSEASANAEQLALLEVCHHGLLVRTLFDELPVNGAEQLRRGNGKIRLADDKIDFRRIREPCDALAAALDQRRAAQDAERNVRADREAQLAERAKRQRRAVVAVQRTQDSCCVGASAAETGLHRDALVDENLKPLRVKARAVEENLRRPPCKVLRILRIALGHKLRLLFAVRQPFGIAVQRPFPTGADIHDHIVTQRNGLLDGANVMIAVLPACEHVKCQVQLCKCAFSQDVHYLIFLPSK